MPVILGMFALLAAVMGFSSTEHVQERLDNSHKYGSFDKPIVYKIDNAQVANQNSLVIVQDDDEILRRFINHRDGAQ